MTSDMENPFVIYRRVIKEIIRRGFSLRQYKVLLLILDTSFGEGKPSATIPPDRWDQSGIQNNHRAEEIKHLAEMRVILCAPHMNLFQINLEFDLWQVTPGKKFDYDKYADLCLLNRDSGSIDLTTFSRQFDGQSPAKSGKQPENPGASLPINQDSSETSGTGSKFFNQGGR